MNHFVTKEVEIFYPYEEEIPWDLLAQTGIDEVRQVQIRSDPLVRVAKHDGRVIGVYLLTCIDSQSYELDGVAVEPHHRGRGLGSWLVGHAIGVTESKGGRTLRTDTYSGTLLSRAGFVETGAGWMLTITPE